MTLFILVSKSIVVTRHFVVAAFVTRWFYRARLGLSILLGNVLSGCGGAQHRPGEFAPPSLDGDITSCGLGLVHVTAISVLGLSTRQRRYGPRPLLRIDQ